MATFNIDPVPHEKEWSPQWKNNLSNLVKKLKEFTVNAVVSTLTTVGLLVQGDTLVEDSLDVDGDLSAEDGAFGGEVTIAEDLYVGGTINAENSPNYISITAAGTLPPITGIPSWVRCITVIFDAVSVSGTDDVLIQLGGESTGYTNAVALIQSGASPSITSSTSGFIVLSSAATDALYGSYVFTLIDPSTNLWSATMNFERTGSLRIQVGAGRKALSSILTQLRVVVSGVNTFDAGTITVRLEP